MVVLAEVGKAHDEDFVSYWPSQMAAHSKPDAVITKSTEMFHVQRTKALSILAVAGSTALAVTVLANAADAQEVTIKGKEEAEVVFDPTKTWPCVQRKVDKITPAQMWDGPPIDEVKGWYQDDEVNALMESAASRRIPLEQIEGKIKTFAEKQTGSDRDRRLTLMFAGLFDKLARQRRTIMAGIVKYQKAQIQRSKEIERQSTAIEDLKTNSGSDDKVAKELEKKIEEFNWTQRIFQERQTNIPLACELPVLLEERLYGVAQAIRANMDN